MSPGLPETGEKSFCEGVQKRRRSLQMLYQVSLLSDSTMSIITIQERQSVLSRLQILLYSVSVHQPVRDILQGILGEESERLQKQGSWCHHWLLAGHGALQKARLQVSRVKFSQQFRSFNTDTVQVEGFKFRPPSCKKFRDRLRISLKQKKS